MYLQGGFGVNHVAGGALDDDDVALLIGGRDADVDVVVFHHLAHVLLRCLMMKGCRSVGMSMSLAMGTSSRSAFLAASQFSSRPRIMMMSSLLGRLRSPPRSHRCDPLWSPGRRHPPLGHLDSAEDDPGTEE